MPKGDFRKEIAEALKYTAVHTLYIRPQLQNVRIFFIATKSRKCGTVHC